MAPSMQRHPLEHVVGRTVPGGEYQIAGYESWLAHDALYPPGSRAAPGDGLCRRPTWDGVHGG